jgi:hypothetical protein
MNTVACVALGEAALGMLREILAQRGRPWVEWSEPPEQSARREHVAIMIQPSGDRAVPAWATTLPVVLLAEEQLVAPVVRVGPGLALVAPPWHGDDIVRALALLEQAGPDVARRERTTEHVWSAVIGDDTGSVFEESAAGLAWRRGVAPSVDELRLDVDGRRWTYASPTGALRLLLMSDRRVPRLTTWAARAPGSCTAAIGDVMLALDEGALHRALACLADLPTVEGWRVLRRFESEVSAEQGDAVGVIIEFRG